MKFCPSCNKTFEDQVGFCPDDGEVLLETTESIVGRVLDGKYKVESFIAQGGMGAVYRARHILLGDRVVIKTMHSDMRDNSKWVRRFQREGRAARSFSHPNAVTVHDLSTTSDGLIYLVMEYVEGQTLDKELKRHGAFTPAEAIDILAPVADVLDAAHAHGVVHRDLKPENIMIGEATGGHRSVKVLDLGIAKMLEMPETQSNETASLTVAGQLLGTPYYMSPEQWGEPARDGNPEVDARTDIYSLGVIFFELVAGRKPFGGRTLPEVRQQHVASALPLLHEVVPGVTEAFGRAVARAMARDRNDRQQAAGQLIAELRATFGTASTTSAMVVDTVATVLFEDVDRQAPGARTSEAAARGTQPAVSAGLGKDETTVARRPISGAPKFVAADGQDVAAAKKEMLTAALARASATRRSHKPLIIGGALVVLLLAGVVGWLVWNRTRAKTSDEASTKPAAARPASAAPAMMPVISYWIESFDQQRNGEGKRVADLTAHMVAGQEFKVHFKAPQSGYLYIIAPLKEGNAPTTFLTALGDNRGKTNQVVSDAEFDFPFGKEGRLRLDNDSATLNLTVIFSPMPLESPAFLNGKVKHELTPAEVKELADFRAQQREVAPTLESRNEGGEQVVAVLAPGGAQERAVVFDIRIEYK
ncbi:MAG TPA: serine/threonine-protein kinase [Pyrinomonadaceae bacterium]